MDFLIKKEIEALKKDITSKNIAVEADKYAFEIKLINGLGDEIKKQIENPPKENLFLKLRNKFLRWKHVKHEMNILKKGGY